MDTATKIVEAIINDLSGRSGLDMIGNLKYDDPEVYEEMFNTLVGIAQEKLDGSRL